jgi:hypothetical protein
MAPGNVGHQAETLHTFYFMQNLLKKLQLTANANSKHNTNVTLQAVIYAMHCASLQRNNLYSGTSGVVPAGTPSKRVLMPINKE